MRCNQTERRYCHLRTHMANAAGGRGGDVCNVRGGSFPLATAYSASILRAACPWAPIMPPSSMAKAEGHKRVAPPVGSWLRLGGVCICLKLLALHLPRRKPRHIRNPRKALTCSGHRSRVRKTRVVWGNYRKLPHLLVVSVGNSADPGPAWSCKRPCGGRGGGGGAIGGEIALPPPSHVSL